MAQGPVWDRMRKGDITIKVYKVILFEDIWLAFNKIIHGILKLLWMIYQF